MAIATARGKENAAAGYAGAATHASLHTMNPGTTGAGEVAGGSPAYSRRAITWSAGATDGVYMGSLSAPFDVPEGSTITHVGLWTAATGGAFLDAAPLDATFTSQGTLQVTNLTYTQT